MEQAVVLVNPRKKGDIVTVKLISGEEVVGRWDSKENCVLKLTKPLMVTMTAEGPAMAPWVFSSDILGEPHIEVNEQTVVTVINTHKPFADAYLQGTTGIVGVGQVPNNLKN